MFKFQGKTGYIVPYWYTKFSINPSMRGFSLIGSKLFLNQCKEENCKESYAIFGNAYVANN